MLTPGTFADSAALYAAVQRMLGQGVASGHHSCHMAVAATVGLDGGPKARIIVIRQFLSESRRIEFHTDVRSPKVTELRRDPRIALNFYDAESRSQMRLAARATINAGNDRARESWQLVPAVNRALFMSPFQPSGELTEGVVLDDMPIPDQTDESGFAHFAAVVCEFDEVDVLWLRAEGHLRSRLAWSPDGWRLFRLCP
ncbi:MAG: pyridoxamine 5'-phosphate oxidase family protein [Gemmataceae bacterium]|nr:pyridoxamine 5'-phosphate oxidase family protein [Gemmataceae bacterium]